VKQVPRPQNKKAAAPQEGGLRLFSIISGYFTYCRRTPPDERGQHQLKNSIKKSCFEKIAMEEFYARQLEKSSTSPWSKVPVFQDKVSVNAAGLSMMKKGSIFSEKSLEKLKPTC